MEKQNEIKIIGNIYGAGCYALKDEDTGDVLYIGTSLELNDALKSRHTYNLERGLYANTNKALLQEKFLENKLIFEVIHQSEDAKTVRNMTEEQKDSLQKALSVLEEFYIELFRKTCINKQNKVTRHSSNRDESSTIKRKKANMGLNNPNSKYPLETIVLIKTLLNEGVSNKEIERKTGIDANYISQIRTGQKWSSLDIEKIS